MTPADLATLIAATPPGQWIDGGGQSVSFGTAASFTCGSALLQNFTLFLPFNGYAFRPQGSGGTPISPTSALFQTQTNVPLISPVSLTFGTPLFIISDDLWGPGAEKASQWTRVRSVSPDGLTIYTTDPLDYDFAINPKIYIPSLISVGARRCKFIGSGVANNQTIFRPEWGYKPIIEDCQFFECGDVALELWRCLDHEVQGNIGFSVGGARNYFFSRDGGCQGGIAAENTGYGFRHMDTGGGTSGLNRKYSVRSITGWESLDAIIDTHEATDIVSIDGVGGSFAPGISKDIVMLQGARQQAKNIAVSGSNSGIVWQPGTRMVDDFAELEGVVDKPFAGDQYALLLDNVKPGGSIANFKGTIRGLARRGVMVKNRSAASITKTVIDAQIKTTGFAAAIEQQAGAGAITQTEFRGQYERANTSAEAIQIYGSGVDTVYVNGSIQGGSVGINNVNSTNVRVTDAKRVTGQSSAKSAGAVTFAVP